MWEVRGLVIVVSLAQPPAEDGRHLSSVPPQFLEPAAQRAALQGAFKSCWASGMSVSNHPIHALDIGMIELSSAGGPATDLSTKEVIAETKNIFIGPI